MPSAATEISRAAAVFLHELKEPLEEKDTVTVEWYAQAVTLLASAAPHFETWEHPELQSTIQAYRLAACKAADQEIPVLPPKAFRDAFGLAGVADDGRYYHREEEELKAMAKACSKEDLATKKAKREQIMRRWAQANVAAKLATEVGTKVTMSKITTKVISTASDVAPVASSSTRAGVKRSASGAALENGDHDRTLRNQNTTGEHSRSPSTKRARTTITRSMASSSGKQRALSVDESEDGEDASGTSEADDSEGEREVAKEASQTKQAAKNRVSVAKGPLEETKWARSQACYWPHPNNKWTSRVGNSKQLTEEDQAAVRDRRQLLASRNVAVLPPSPRLTSGADASEGLMPTLRAISVAVDKIRHRYMSNPSALAHFDALAYNAVGAVNHLSTLLASSKKLDDMGLLGDGELDDEDSDSEDVRVERMLKQILHFAGVSARVDHNSKSSSGGHEVSEPRSCSSTSGNMN
ncbi:hypothetical protein EIP91_011966 [Steccherinum ochraceum]|uniref:Uncharacterized protein n=1 Tax=Steccherinum ochraceum TaxID=92696 RepID=A0A4R0RH37_9APHY|nr:hypothetical protein EIP91_011966 [Steccherinum ochraceum]